MLFFVSITTCHFSLLFYLLRVTWLKWATTVFSNFCSGQPPDELLRLGSNTNRFFKRIGSIYSMENDAMCKRISNTYQFLTEEEYEAVCIDFFFLNSKRFNYFHESFWFFYFNLISQRESKKPVIGKHYYNFVKLEDIITNYPYKKNLPEEEISKGYSDACVSLKAIIFFSSIVISVHT